MNTKLDFGKFKGKTIKELFDMDKENYIYWMYHKTDYVLSEKVINCLNVIDFENNDLRREISIGNN